MLNIDDLFKGRHFDQEIIILCARWYLRFKLSFRDLGGMMAERGISLARTTIMCWIPRDAPEFEERWNRFACRSAASWRVDETYVKIKGRWTYLYRAVDKEGKTVDFLLRAKPDVAAAKAFFRRAFKSQGRLPRAITLDGYQASHRAAREVLSERQRGARTEIRSSNLNNLIEQDRRSIKLRLYPMLGLKRFRSASITIASIELMIGSGKVSSDSASLASKAKRPQKSGMLFCCMSAQAFQALRCVDSTNCTTAMCNS
jgi:transposase-like protein